MICKIIWAVFSQNSMEKEIKSVAKNIVDVIDKDPLSRDQQINREIIKIMKDNPNVNHMELIKSKISGRQTQQSRVS